MSVCCDITRLPLGKTGFLDIRNRDKIYVDKTQLIAHMASLDSPLFLSRPRLFGKSLLVDMLHTLFARGLEPFHGLALEELWRDTTYNVVHIDFSSLASKDPNAFAKALRNKILYEFDIHDKNIALDITGECRSPDEIFGIIADDLVDNSTVLLIDEYDAPLTYHMNNADDLQDIMRILNSFYAVIKEYSRKFRFIFMTGVTRTAHVSIFSAFNNLRDLSLEKEYNALLGFTEDEIRKYFDQFVGNAANTLGLSKNAVYARLAQWYDGFQFALDAGETLYNPWSVLSFLQSPKNGFQNYWYQSGGISTLVASYLKVHDNVDFMNYDSREIVVDRQQLADRYELADMPREILLWQAGYFSLRTRPSGSLRLVPPNGEVEASLLRLYFTANNLKPEVHTRELIEQLVAPIDRMDLLTIVGTFNAILHTCVSPKAAIFKDERSVRDIIFTALFLFAPLQLLKERESVRGYSDLELITSKTHMVIEFTRTYPKGETGSSPRDAKASLAEAIDQIESHHYGEAPFSVQTLFRVAMVISTEEKKILPEYCAIV